MMTASTTKTRVRGRAPTVERERLARESESRLEALAAYEHGLKAFIEAEQAYLAALCDARTGQVELARADAARHDAVRRIQGQRIAL